MHPSKQTNILNYENFEILIFLFTQPLINKKNLANLIFVIYYVMFDFRKNTKETIYIYIYIYFEENNFLMFFFCFFYGKYKTK